MRFRWAERAVAKESGVPVGFLEDRVFREVRLLSSLNSVWGTLGEGRRLTFSSNVKGGFSFFAGRFLGGWMME